MQITLPILKNLLILKKVSVHHGCKNETTNNCYQIWYKVHMHKASPNDSVSCCSWRCLHVLVAVVSNYPFKEKESLLSKKEREKASHL